MTFCVLLIYELLETLGHSLAGRVSDQERFASELRGQLVSEETVDCCPGLFLYGLASAPWERWVIAGMFGFWIFRAEARAPSQSQS